jgi:hypothetical protein
VRTSPPRPGCRYGRLRLSTCSDVRAEFGYPDGVLDISRPHIVQTSEPGKWRLNILIESAMESLGSKRASFRVWCSWFVAVRSSGGDFLRGPIFVLLAEALPTKRMGCRQLWGRGPGATRAPSSNFAIGRKDRGDDVAAGVCWSTQECGTCSHVAGLAPTGSRSTSSPRTFRLTPLPAGSRTRWAQATRGALVRGTRRDRPGCRQIGLGSRVVTLVSFREPSAVECRAIVLVDAKRGIVIVDGSIEITLATIDLAPIGEERCLIRCEPGSPQRSR